MPFEVSVDSDLEKAWREACREFVDETRQVAVKAADDGAAHSRESHPYQDHTYHLTDTTVGKLEAFDGDGATAEIVWVQDYASYVDQGTSRAAAKPFVDDATKVAKAALERGVHTLVEKTESRMNR